MISPVSHLTPDQQLFIMRREISQLHVPIGQKVEELITKHIVNGQYVLGNDSVFIQAMYYLVRAGTRATVIRCTPDWFSCLPRHVMNQGVLFARNGHDRLLGFKPQMIECFHKLLRDRLQASPKPPIPPIAKAYRDALDLFEEVIGIMHFLARRFEPMGAPRRQPPARRPSSRSSLGWVPESELPLRLVVNNVTR